jgi:hypothetical protein
MIPPGVFVFLLAIGGALIALWIDARFPRLAPETLRASFVHAALAFVALAFVPAAIDPMLGAADAVVRVVAIFGVVFPVLVYAFLAFTWLAKPLVSSLPGR